MAPLHSLGQDDQNEVQHNIFGHVIPFGPALASCHPYSIVHGTIPFLRSRKLKWDATLLFGHLLPLALAISVTWCQQQYQWHHCIPWVTVTNMRCNMTFWVMWFHWYWHHCHVMLIVSSVAPVHFLGATWFLWSCDLIMCSTCWLQITLHKSQKKKEKCTHNCNFYFPCYNHTWANSKYGPEMPHMSITSYAHMRQISLYKVTHETLWPTMSPKALVYINCILLTYVPDQICLPHCICIPHCTTTVIYIYTPHYYIYK